MRNTETIRFKFEVALITAAVGVLLFNGLVFSQSEKFTSLPITREAWTKTYPPFRIVGNLYYVGG